MSDMTLFYAEMTQFEEPAPDRAADRIRYRSVWRPWGLRFEWALVPQLRAMITARPIWDFRERSLSGVFQSSRYKPGCVMVGNWYGCRLVLAEIGFLYRTLFESNF